MPNLFDTRRVPRERSSFRPDQRTPNNALAGLAIKQNCGMLLTNLTHATATKSRHWRCLYCCRSILMAGEAKRSIYCIETRKRTKRVVACCLVSCGPAIPPALADSTQSNPRGDILARRLAAMQERIDRCIARLSLSSTSQTRRKRHWCLSHKAIATC